MFHDIKHLLKSCLVIHTTSFLEAKAFPLTSINQADTRRCEQLFKNLEVEMFKRNMSTADLAKKVGICESSMRNKIVGRRDFKFSEFRKVLQAFPGLSWEYLFEREEDTACEEASEQESAS